MKPLKTLPVVLEVKITERGPAWRALDVAASSERPYYLCDPMYEREMCLTLMDLYRLNSYEAREYMEGARRVRRWDDEPPTLRELEAAKQVPPKFVFDGFDSLDPGARDALLAALKRGPEPPPPPFVEIPEFDEP